MSHRLGTIALPLATMFVTLCVGCVLPADGEDESADQQEKAFVAGNGVSLNGVSLNGVSLNGVSLNGVSLNGVSLNGVSLNGVSLNGVSLNGSSLTSKTSKGATLSGSQLIGSEFSGPLYDGSAGKFRIDDHEVIDGDVNLYTISWRKNQGQWQYACGTQDGVPVRAVPLKGSWNYGDGVDGGGSKTDNAKITLACEHYALAKCVEFGYKPWVKYSGNKTFADHHQACTRMLRADYCGNGHSWTVDGTPVNLYDNKGVQSDDANWPFEAEWTTDGALCLSHQRIQNLPVVPQCSFKKTPAKCGSPVSWNKALLASEAQ